MFFHRSIPLASCSKSLNLAHIEVRPWSRQEMRIPRRVIETFSRRKEQLSDQRVVWVAMCWHTWKGGEGGENLAQKVLKLINLGVPVLGRSLKSSNIELS